MKQLRNKNLSSKWGLSDLPRVYYAFLEFSIKQAVQMRQGPELERFKELNRIGELLREGKNREAFSRLKLHDRRFNAGMVFGEAA